MRETPYSPLTFSTPKPLHLATHLEDPFTLALNLAGTFAFGISGGILGVRKRMDLFGVLVLSVSTGLGGGIMRDLILGHTPPATLADWRYPATAALAGLLVFTRYARVVHHPRFITGFDALGLGIFTVTGTSIALDAGLTQYPGHFSECLPESEEEYCATF